MLSKGPPRNSGTTINYSSEVGLLQHFLQLRKLSRVAGAQPEILMGWGANSNQASTFKYTIPLVFKASSIKYALFWHFFFLNNFVPI